MPTSSTRLEIVTRALAIAGRDASLRTFCEQRLNDILRSWALEYKYPSLRKTGDAQTLSAGSSSLALPSDFGAGMDSLMLGNEKIPIYERMVDEFVQLGGFTNPATGSSGRPTMYMVDNQARLFRFNSNADQAYQVVPIYFYVPAALGTPNDSVADASTLWVDNDEMILQGLVQAIYQYTGDVREKEQYQYLQSLKADYRRGSVPIGGGVNKVMFSRQTFKARRSF